MDGDRSARFDAHVDLPASDGPVAEHADASIVKRMPFSPRISRLQNREFFFGQERLIHFA
jgi:hypothetical protein